jgi:retinol dehydrogenase-12
MDNRSSHEPLAGRVALVTGANTGIGLVTARALAAQGAEVHIACRARGAAEAAAKRIASETGKNVQLLELDLGDLDSVRRAASTFLASGRPLHILVNNAGVAGARGKTRSGFELAFGVNHIGHFLLTTQLLPRLRESGHARIVNVASKAHYQAKRIDWDALVRTTRTLTALPEYAVSKLANVLFSAELARRLSGSGVHTYALHPGVIASDVWRSVPQPFRYLMTLPMKSTEQGAATSIYLASSPTVAGDSGLYYDDCATREPSPLAQDGALARELWTRSEAWVAA